MNRDLIDFLYECSLRGPYCSFVADGLECCPYMDYCDRCFYVKCKYDINLRKLLYIIYAEGEI